MAKKELSQTIRFSKLYLQTYRTLDAQLKIIEEEIARLETEAEHITAATDLVAVQSTKGKDRIGTLAVKIADLRCKAIEQKNDAIEVRQQITEKICKLKDAKLMQILYLRYIKFKTWEEISVEIKHYLRHTHRLHSLALQELEKILIKDGIE